MNRKILVANCSYLELPPVYLRRLLPTNFRCLHRQTTVVTATSSLLYDLFGVCSNLTIAMLWCPKLLQRFGHLAARVNWNIFVLAVVIGSRKAEFTMTIVGIQLLHQAFVRLFEHCFTTNV